MENNNNYQSKHILYVVFQMLFIALAFFDSILHIIINFDEVVEIAGTNNASYFAGIVMIVMITVYAVWGYKKSIVPFRLAIIVYYMILTMRLTRYSDDILDDSSLIVLLLCTILLLCILTCFDNTFKKHKKAAIPASIILVIVELASGIISIIQTDGSFADKMASQPLIGFWLSGSLAMTYLVRCHWSMNGKISVFNDEEE